MRGGAADVAISIKSNQDRDADARDDNMKYLKIIVLLAVIILLPVTIISANPKIKAPENGKLNTYKEDFECDRGYTKNFKNWSCDEIKLPENGVLTFAGNGWTCISEYKREGDSCKKVILPENAKFHIEGSDFYCNFGYKKVGEKCEKLELPSNAHWSYDGNDWECSRGYKPTDDNKSCIEVKIPDNAQGNYIGTFTCNSGFKKVGDKCEKQPDVENGKFYTTGADFYCSHGYKKNESERKCEKIKVPENAHQDNLALEGWSCTSEYVRRGDKCEKFSLPDHAFFAGNTWKCELGYRKNPTSDSCQKINLPENAKYVETYDGWNCNTGYTKNYKENRCDKTS